MYAMRMTNPEEGTVPRPGQIGISNKHLGGPTTAFTVTVKRDTLYPRVVAHCEELGISASAWFRELAEKELEAVGR
jgi:hypothetical protein